VERRKEGRGELYGCVGRRSIIFIRMRRVDKQTNKRNKKREIKNKSNQQAGEKEEQKGGERERERERQNSLAARGKGKK
jgi:hypothetical protein